MSDVFAADRRDIEQRLDEICQSCLSGVPAGVADAVRYGLKSPGKRIRPLLLLFAYRAAGGAGDATLLACAPEVIHAYSLIHDDLPCMDDDDIRRGRPTAHKVYGSRVAILAGVAMVPLAAIVVRDGVSLLGLSQRTGQAINESLLGAGGAEGMIGGQQRDLAAEGMPLGIHDREAVHAAKTGALMLACVRMGALAAGANQARVEALEHYGRSVGLAFQIMDDVLDVTSTTSEMGKTAGRDAVLGKSTYPALLGVDGARSRAQALVDEGLGSLREEGMLTRELSQVANFMVTRTS